MPWENRSVTRMREEFVKEVLAQEKTKSQLCREYGISRPTGDKWIQRYLAQETLEDRSRSPRAVRRIDGAMEQQIVAYRRKYPFIGATKLRKIMENEGINDLPCARTINNVLHRNGLISKEASRAATPIQRFQKSYPNEMLQADFKGHFGMKNGSRCHTLNVTDDFSRFNLCTQALPDETLASVQPVMQRVFSEYGLPFSFLCDNGNPWGTAQSTGFTKFEVWLMELGVLPIHGRPVHPQTQGKEERYNRSFTRECLNQHEFYNLEQAQSIFDEYRDFYNNKRPHCALNMDTPSVRYTPSPQKMPDRIEPWDYDSTYELRQVRDTGYITYRGQGYFLSEALAGKEIAIRESHIPGQITLCFRQFRIARIDVENRVYTLKKIQLLEGDPREK